MKKTLIKVLLLSLVLVMVFGTVSASAFNSYDTYTYSIDGEPLKSPEAYSVNMSATSAEMNLLQEKYGNKTLNKPTDIVSDVDGSLYIADRGNNRVVVLNKYYSATHILDSYVDEYGRAQSFKEPSGVFVTDYNDEKILYVCDTNNYRIVKFKMDSAGEFGYVGTINKPDSDLVKAEAFKPYSIAVDLYGRIFVVSLSCFEGVIVMSGEGDFTGFIGAQKVVANPIQKIWMKFQSVEQRKNQTITVSKEYNNIAVDPDGFIYVTSDKIDPDEQLASIESKKPDYSPVKKLNSAGDEIMNRNGFFDPGGEVQVNSFSSGLGVSKIVDVAVGSEKSWTILDQKRSRFFTYDQDGNLLFAFGDQGIQLGNGANFVGMTYQYVDGTNYLVVLDSLEAKITVYSPTKYCDTIMAALRNQNDHKFSESINYWQKVLTLNNNFDMAYIGIGKALYSQGKYDKSMEMLTKAYETAQYSKAFAQIRKDIIGTWLIPIIIAIIAVLVLFFKFLGWAKKKNKATALKVGKKSYVEELLYVFHLWFHPFDGFWDLKHEKRGSVRAGTTILGITIVAFFYQAIGQGYTYNPRGDTSTVILQLLAVIVPVLLWCVANWCLTTLFDGEGSFKDIYIATTYSLAPLPLLIIISTILTNVMTQSEGSIVSLLVSIGYIWVGILLFFGTMVTHDYSMGKNVLTVLGTIVAMVVIMFVAILFSSLLVKMVTFLISIFSEIGNRVS